MPAAAAPYDVVLTSGRCVACDSDVRNERVVLLEPATPHRPAIVLEVRHLSEPGYEMWRPALDT